jgi:hypothetical protein
MFVSIQPLHVSVFFHGHLQGVLRCALCRYYASHWFAFVEFVLLHSMWPHVYVICVCLVFLSVGVNSAWVGLYNKYIAYLANLVYQNKQYGRRANSRGKSDTSDTYFIVHKFCMVISLVKIYKFYVRSVL